MKKLLAIIVLGLLLSGNANADKYPILKCVFNDVGGEKTTQIYDLNIYAKKASEGDPNYLFNDVSLNDQYMFQRIHPQDNGMVIFIALIVEKKTGSVELTISKPRKLNANIAESIEAFNKGQTFLGICDKVENKNL